MSRVGSLSSRINKNVRLVYRIISVIMRWDKRDFGHRSFVDIEPGDIHAMPHLIAVPHPLSHLMHGPPSPLPASPPLRAEPFHESGSERSGNPDPHR